jgi:hypothetical protein
LEESELFPILQGEWVLVTDDSANVIVASSTGCSEGADKLSEGLLISSKYYVGMLCDQNVDHETCKAHQDRLRDIANFKPDSNKVGKICDNFRVVFQEVQVVLLGSRFVRPSLSILLLGELVPSTIGKERPISAIEIRNCM